MLFTAGGVLFAEGGFRAITCSCVFAASAVPVAATRGSRVLVRVTERDDSVSAVTAHFRTRSSAGKVPAHN